MLIFRDYELPPWTPPDRAVLCSSYSGDTEETLACFEAAEAIGAKRYVATTGGALAEAARAAGVPVIGLPGGLQPRALRSATASPSPRGRGPDRRRPGDPDRDRHGRGQPRARPRDALVARAGEIAEQLAGTVPLIYGCDLTVPVAYRWKSQINENAKQHAFDHQLPEMDHNEIVGWAGATAGAQRFSAVFLSDSDQHPRQRERAELTARADRADAAAVVTIETEGETRPAAAAVGGDARRPRLPAPGGPQRRRPGADRRDRAAQGPARPPMSRRLRPRV